MDEGGFIFVADSGNNRIQIFNPDGTFLRAFGRWGQNDGEFKVPSLSYISSLRESHLINDSGFGGNRCEQLRQHLGGRQGEPPHPDILNSPLT